MAVVTLFMSDRDISKTFTSKQVTRTCRSGQSLYGEKNRRIKRTAS
jgi:hypothetical protein